MDKPFVKKILAVVLGLALIIMIFGTISLIWDAIGMGDLKELSGSLNDIQSFMRWTAVGLAIMVVPALASYVFAFFSDKKLFKITSAVLSLVVVICCITFITLCRNMAVDLGTTSYASAAGYFSELMQLLIASALIGIYFLLISVLPAKKAEKVETEEAENEEN